MSKHTSKVSLPEGPPPEYQAAIADIEERAARGDLTIAEVKREIFALRERFAASPDVVMRWAAQALAQSSMPTSAPLQARTVAPSDGRCSSPEDASDLRSVSADQPV